MRSTCLALVIAAVATTVLGGCGTCVNLASNYPEPYGGIKNDLVFAATPPEHGGVGGKGAIFVWLADFGCSTVADTVTLPFVAYRQAKLDRYEPIPVGYAPQFSSGATVSVFPDAVPSTQDPSGAVVSPPGSPTDH